MNVCMLGIIPLWDYVGRPTRIDANRTLSLRCLLGKVIVCNQRVMVKLPVAVTAF